MIDKLMLWQNAFYEGDLSTVRTIHPLPVISPVTCDFISVPGDRKIIFREDGFDPVTRLRRGRLYVDTTQTHPWNLVSVDNNAQYNWSNMPPQKSYDRWHPSADEKPEQIIGRHIQIGADGFDTRWRIVGIEKTSTGHILLTLRATSLFGVIPELLDTITDKDDKPVGTSQIQDQLNALVDAFHRQQATPTVDVARETARVILREWVGSDAQTEDLADVIPLIPAERKMIQKAAFIINRFHPRGKSSEREAQASKGVNLRLVTDEDAEASIHLIGLLLREIGWAAT